MSRREERWKRQEKEYSVKVMTMKLTSQSSQYHTATLSVQGKQELPFCVKHGFIFSQTLFLSEKLLEVNFLIFQFILELSVILDSLH